MPEGVLFFGRRHLRAGLFRRKAASSDGDPSRGLRQVPGAGDGFAAGVISASLEGFSVPEMTERANALGAMKTMVESDNEGLQDREALAQFLSRNR